MSGEFEVSFLKFSSSINTSLKSSWKTKSHFYYKNNLTFFSILFNEHCSELCYNEICLKVEQAGDTWQKDVAYGKTVVIYWQARSFFLKEWFSAQWTISIFRALRKKKQTLLSSIRGLL